MMLCLGASLAWLACAKRDDRAAELAVDDLIEARQRVRESVERLREVLDGLAREP